MKNVLTKLNKIQTELKAPKGQMNKFGGYKFRSCEDILEAVKPLLAEHKCVLTLMDKANMIGERYYIEALATLIDCETGESYSVTASAREEESKKGMDGSQVTGASSSYARKYALNGLLAIDDTKDSDTTNTHGKTDTQADMPPEERIDETEKITPVAIKALKELLEKKGATLDVEKYGVKKIEELTKDDYFDYVAELRKKPDKKVSK